MSEELIFILESGDTVNSKDITPEQIANAVGVYRIIPKQNILNNAPNND